MHDRKHRFYDFIGILHVKAQLVLVCEGLNNAFIGLWLIWYVVCIVLSSRLREQTHSLWAFLMSEKQNYLNPFYSPAFSELHPVLQPSTLPYHFKSVPHSWPSCFYMDSVLNMNYNYHRIDYHIFRHLMFVCVHTPVIPRFWRNMYHQFDRSMHPRQSILKTILTLRENSRKAESTLQALENVS